MSNEPNRGIPDSALQTTLGSGWMEGEEGADISLDDLFPNPDEPTTAQPVPKPAVAQPAADEVFIRANTGTVYRTKEDAVRGTEEKDRIIEQLRGEVTQLKGTDPLKKANQVVATTPEPDPFDQAAGQMFDRLVDAVQRGDKRAYIETQMEINRAAMSPYAPIIAEVARERAVRQLETKSKGVREFLASSDYEEVLGQIPALKQAIEVSESNPDLATSQLPQLYELAFYSSLGRRAPDLVRAAVQAAPTPEPARPTMQTTTPSLPQAGDSRDLSGQSEDQLLKTPDGRKFIIEQFERSGSADRRWR